MKIAFFTLGCKVNQYETQALKEIFSHRGYEIVEEEDAADIYVVNTCTVTGLADRKSRQYIRRMKKRNPQSITAVVGCYAQTSPEEVQQMEEVDIVLGTKDKSRLPEYLEDYIQGGRQQLSNVFPYQDLTDYEETGSITSMDSRTRAYIKVQEGCNQFCSYCIIPFARGRIRSRSLSEIRREAESLIEKGFKELVITGINAALYGMEPGYEMDEDFGISGITGIEAVICMLNEIPGDFRLRLGSLEPTVINAEYVKRLLSYEKLCPHMHLSLQSGSDKILKAMNRHYQSRDYLEIVSVLRERDPGYGITTDIIVGFPGEEEEDFQDSVRMVETVRYAKVHVFPYSKREGTKAAAMSGQISPPVKKERAASLAEAGEQAAAAFFQGLRGMKRRVLFEEYEEALGEIWGYSDNYVRVCCTGCGVEAAKALLNGFAEVELGEPYRDGIKGIAVTG